MAYKIDTVSAREKLPTRHDPYWLRIAKGCYLGYRKKTAVFPGVWQARCTLSDGQRPQTTLGTLEEHRPHERFDKAVSAARAWFEANLNPSTKHAKVTTVRDACDDYVIHVREQRGDGSAMELEARYRRWVWDDPIHSIELFNLTREHLNGFRQRVLHTPVRIHKSGETRGRSKDTVNRDIATLRAALNYAFAQDKAPSDAPWREPLKAFKGVSKRRMSALVEN